MHRRTDETDERIVNMPKAALGAVRSLCVEIGRKLRARVAPDGKPGPIDTSKSAIRPLPV